MYLDVHEARDPEVLRRSTYFLSSKKQFDSIVTIYCTPRVKEFRLWPNGM